MRKIQSRRPGKNHVKSCSTTPYLSFHLILSPPQRPLCVVGSGGWKKEKMSAQIFSIIVFLLGNPAGAPESLPKMLSTQMKPAECHGKENNNNNNNNNNNKRIKGREKRKKRGGKKARRKSEDRCVTFKSKISKFYFLRMPELRKLIFCIWIRRSRGVRPRNSFVVSFSSL